MTSVQVQLVYDCDCPHVDEARAMIRAALESVGADVEWREWDRADSRTPPELRGYGSPTVLVNGHDVDGSRNEPADSDASSCRLYFDECSCICGAPTASVIARAIRDAQDE